LIFIKCPSATNDAMARYSKNCVCDAIRYCGHVPRGTVQSYDEAARRYAYTVCYQSAGEGWEPLPEGFEPIGARASAIPRIAQLMDERTDPSEEALGALSPSERKKISRDDFSKP
jgi:hypothetical protein